MMLGQLINYKYCLAISQDPFNLWNNKHYLKIFKRLQILKASQRRILIYCLKTMYTIHTLTLNLVAKTKVWSILSWESTFNIILFLFQHFYWFFGNFKSYKTVICTSQFCPVLPSILATHPANKQTPKVKFVLPIHSLGSDQTLWPAQKLPPRPLLEGIYQGGGHISILSQLTVLSKVFLSWLFLFWGMGEDGQGWGRGRGCHWKLPLSLFLNVHL